MAVTSTLYTTTATQVAGTWTNPTSATGAPDATGTTAPTNCATWVNAARSTTATLELSGYNFSSAVGALDTITSVAATIPHAETSTANITALTAQLYSGATAIGTAVTMTRVTSLTSHTVTFPTAPTYAQLADLRVRITATRANNTTSSTEYIDAAGLAVTYTPVTAVTLPYTQTWTGTDGASWPAEWIPNGGTITIQSNTGQLTTPVGGYDGALALLAGMPATADVEVLVDVTAISTGVEQYPEIVLRGGTTRSGTRPVTGYSLFLCYAATPSAGFIQVERQNAGSTILGSQPSFAFTGGVTYRVRFRVVGADLSVKVWDASTTEPGAWTWTFTDPTPYLTAGRVWLIHGNGADGIVRSAQFDNLTVAVPAPNFAVHGARSVTRASRPPLTQASGLTVKAARAVTRASRPKLTQQQPPVTIKAARSTTRAGRPLLSQAQAVVVRAARSVTRAGGALLTQQQGPLTVHGARATSRASRPLLSQQQPVLTVPGARSAARAGRALLDQYTPLTVTAARSDTHAERATLTQASPLTVHDARAETRASDVRLVVAGEIAVRDARARTRASTPLLTQDTTLAVRGARSATRAQAVTLGPAATTLIFRDARAQTRATVPALEHLQLLAISGARAPTRASRVTLPGGTQPSAPPERTLTVPADNRTVTVDPDSRTVTVSAENRTQPIAAENRTLTVPATT